jgi:hypothetical protein
MLAAAGDHPPALVRVYEVGFPILAAASALYVGVQPYVTLTTTSVLQYVAGILASLIVYFVQLSLK